MKYYSFFRTSIYIGIASLCIFPNHVQCNSTENTVKVGFSSIDLARCIKSTQGYRIPLEAKCMYIEENMQKTLLFALDFGEVFHEFCQDVQTRIGEKLNINPESILIHTTHTHSGPWDHNQGESMINRQELVSLLIRAANDAITVAKPSRVKIAQQDVGKSLSVNRRGDTGTGLGVQTYWFGYEYAENDNRPEASALINEMSSRWQGKLGNYNSSPNKVYFDGEVDPLVQTMYFVDLKDNPLGSIVRFSAHPHMTSFFRESLFDPDFPGRTRKLMEKELGGHCLFLQGTSGNIVPKERVKYQLMENYKFESIYLGPLSEFYAVDENVLLSETIRIGEAIAQTAINALKKVEFARLTKFNYNYKPLNIPLNPALLKSTEEIEVLRAALTAEYNAFLNTNGALNEMRRLANAINWLDWGAYYALGFTNATDRENGYKPMPYSVLNINTLPIVFMHSEVSVETTLALREKFSELNPWIISLTGGTISYIPTDKMIDEGGYEGRNTVIKRGAESLIREHIATMLK